MDYKNVDISLQLYKKIKRKKWTCYFLEAFRFVSYVAAMIVYGYNEAQVCRERHYLLLD